MNMQQMKKSISNLPHHTPSSSSLFSVASISQSVVDFGFQHTHTAGEHERRQKMLAIMKNDYDLFAFFTRFQSYDNLWVNITIIAWPTHTHTHIR